MPGHSRPKDGVASLAYDPGIHAKAPRNAIGTIGICRAISWIAGSSPAMTAECAGLQWSPHFLAENKLIPGLESGLIFVAPCSIEGVVDRDA
jgi:hypothetical protein